MTLRAVRWLLVAFALLAFAIAVDNMARPLANPDEGRYSEISREMAISGDWLTPRLDGIKYFEKPPLQYWATAVAFKAIGFNEYAARLYTWLCAVATVLVVAYTARRLGDLETAVATVLALGASPYFLGMGGVVTLDMGLTLWTTINACAFLLAEHARAERRSSAARRWMLAAWVALALGVLSKGLVAIIFAGAVVFFRMLLQRNLSVLRRLEWAWGLPLFLAIAAPWFVLVSRANPEFARFFFIHEHFERFLTHEARRVQPWWFFIPIFFAGFLPWMFALPAAARDAWRSEAGRDEQPLRIAMLAALFIVAFFSVSGSKLPAYILPAFPLFGLALGRYLARAAPRPLARRAFLAIPVGIAMFAAAYLLPGQARDSWTRELNQLAQPMAYAAATVFTLGMAGAALLLRRGQRWAAIVVVAIANVVLIDCVEDAYEAFTPRQSGIDAARAMAPFAKPPTRLYSVKTYDQSLPFYLGRTLRLVAYVDEFETGLEAEPGIAIEKLADFPADWLRPGDAVAIIQPDTFEELQRQGLPMKVIHQDPKRVLVRKP